MFLAFSSKEKFWLSTEILNFGSENEMSFKKSLLHCPALPSVFYLKNPKNQEQSLFLFS